MDEYNYDYSTPKYDEQRKLWYWEGRRPGTGKRVRKYAKPDEGQGNAAQFDSTQYTQSTYKYPSHSVTADIETSMQNMNLQQPTVDPYGTVAPNYTTYQADSQAQGSAAYTGDSAPSNYQTTPRTIPASTIEQTLNRPIASDQGASGTRDRLNYSHLGQSESVGASYAVGGDRSTQMFDEGKGKYPANLYSGKHASGQQSGYGANHEYSDYHGAAQYGQSPPGADYDGYSLDKPRKSKHKGKEKADVLGRRGAEDTELQYRGYSQGVERGSQWPSGPTSVTQELQYRGTAHASGSGPSRAPFQGGANTVSTTLDYDDPALLPSTTGIFSMYDYGGTGGKPARGGRTYEEASGEMAPLTPHPGSSRSHGKDIIGTKGQFEPLDKRYRVEHSSRFEPGEVFKIMWTEPRGAPIGGGSMITEVIALQDHKDNVWTGFRRFIIIANDEGHCTCVPILTYGNQGCRKAGVKPNKHGIVCEQGTNPAPLPNEPKLGFAPIRLQMAHANEHISGESRVNYSKLVTVEHNVKVFFIGRVSYEDWPTVASAVDQCWEAKNREKSHHSHHGNRRTKK